MKWADYCVCKLTKSENGFISTIICYEDLGNSLGDSFERNRSWMVEQVLKGKTFCSIKTNEKGGWNNIGEFSYDGKIFSWKIVPENITKRKTFISYYHYEDQEYKEKFKNLFDDLITHKSVEDGDINPSNSHDYVKHLIQEGYLNDTTVLVVLIGLNTKHRMHVDWEIYGALDPRVGDKCAGILGLVLPSHPDFGRGKIQNNSIPARLLDNLPYYAIIRDWTNDRVKMQEYIELAFSRRETHYGNRNNSRIQMKEDTNE